MKTLEQTRLTLERKGYKCLDRASPSHFGNTIYDYFEGNRFDLIIAYDKYSGIIETINVYKN